jgi:hypothetical protein
MLSRYTRVICVPVRVLYRATPVLATFVLASAAAQLDSGIRLAASGAGGPPLGLVDHIRQGLAGGDESRTAQNWSLGQHFAVPAHAG